MHFSIYPWIFSFNVYCFSYLHPCVNMFKNLIVLERNENERVCISVDIAKLALNTAKPGRFCQIMLL